MILPSANRFYLEKPPIRIDPSHSFGMLGVFSEVFLCSGLDEISLIVIDMGFTSLKTC